MPLRLVEIIAPDTQRQELDRELEQMEVEEVWREEMLEDRYRVRGLFRAEDVEPVTDRLNQRFSSVRGFRVIISEVEATIPRLDRDEEEDEEDGASWKEEAEGAADTPSVGRVSREELRAELSDAARTSPTYFVMLVLSAMVAAFGFYHQNIALLIAAMVIAPIIGPNIALAFATTIADLNLFFRSLVSTFLGALTVFALTLLLGGLQPIEAGALTGMKTFYQVELWHIALGFCAGTAGTLSFTRGFSTSLVGVTVAVALLPPMAAAGLLMGSGFVPESGSALLLATNNVVSIIIAGIGTFLVQGVRPMDWWKNEETNRLTWIAVSLWLLLLAILAGITYSLQF